MNNSVQQEALYFLNQNEEQLLREIGRLHASHVMHLGVIPDDIELGRKWFEFNEVIIYGLLCIEHEICSKLSASGFNDEVTILLGVADVICGSFTGIPPFLVSALILKKGLSKFCQCKKEMSVNRRRRILGNAVILYDNLSHEINQFTDNPNKEIIVKKKDEKTLVYTVIKNLYKTNFAQLLEGYKVPLPD